MIENLKLIPAHPDEVVLATFLIYSSGPAAFEFVFQNEKYKALDFLRYAFIKKGGEFSYDNHHSLYYKNEMVGIGSAFNGESASNFKFWDGLRILKFYGFNSFGVVSHGLSIEKLIKLPKSSNTALAHLGIKKEFRGKGFGTFLINELMKTQSSNTKKFVLDVSEENPRAKELYTNLGFIVTSKNISNLKSKYSSVPNHFRMEMPQM